MRSPGAHSKANVPELDSMVIFMARDGRFLKAATQAEGDGASREGVRPLAHAAKIGLNDGGKGSDPAHRFATWTDARLWARTAPVATSRRHASHMPLQAGIVTVTPFQQNCTLIWDEATGRGAVVDPGGDL